MNKTITKLVDGFKRNAERFWYGEPLKSQKFIADYSSSMASQTSVLFMQAQPVNLSQQTYVVREVAQEKTSLFHAFHKSSSSGVTTIKGEDGQPVLFTREEAETKIKEFETDMLARCKKPYSPCGFNYSVA